MVFESFGDSVSALFENIDYDFLDSMAAEGAIERTAEFVDQDGFEDFVRAMDEAGFVVKVISYLMIGGILIVTFVITRKKTNAG